MDILEWAAEQAKNDLPFEAINRMHGRRDGATIECSLYDRKLNPWVEPNWNIVSNTSPSVWTSVYHQNVDNINVELS